MLPEIDILDDDLNDDPNCENMLVSIHFEWPIYDFGRVKGKISVAKIGANISNERSHRLVLPFGRHTKNKQFLIWIQQLLARFDVVFIGRMIANYISELKKAQSKRFFFYIKCG